MDVGLPVLVSRGAGPPLPLQLGGTSCFGLSRGGTSCYELLWMRDFLFQALKGQGFLL